MAQVKVVVLKPFGSYSPGDTVELSEDRIAFLEGKGLVELSGESIDNKVSPEAYKLMGEIKQFLSLENVEGEGVLDFLQRIVTSVSEGKLVAVPKSESSFQEAMKRSFGPLIATKLIEAGFDSVESILAAEPKDIESLDGIGAKTVEKLVDFASEF